MNTAFLWIFLPFLMGILMLFFQDRKNIILILGVFLCLALAIFALLVPFEEVVILGGQTFSLTNQLSIAGLEFVMTNQIRPILVLFYLYLAFLFSGTYAAESHQNFIPNSLIISTLILGGLSIKPILFGILFFQPAAFMSTLLLIPPGSKPGKGVLRFLIYQVMGLMFLLFAIWSISEGSEIIENPEAFRRAILLFWVGFSFIFAIFPLYTWVTMVAESTHPYSAVFVFSSFFGGYTFFLLSMLENYSWFFGGENFFEIFRIAGFILIVSAGIGAAFQSNLGRLFGFAVLIEVGYSLIAIAFNYSQLFWSMLLPRVFALSVWALGLSILRKYTKELSFNAITGLARQFPFAGGAVILAQFSLCGVPLLAGFPLLLEIWNKTASYSIILATWIFLGNIGLLFGSLRAFSSLVTGPETLTWQEKEDKVQIVYLTAGLIILFLMGLFPHWFYLFFDRIIGGVRMLNL